MSKNHFTNATLAIVTSIVTAEKGGPIALAISTGEKVGRYE
jgi:hypothetical protein